MLTPFFELSQNETFLTVRIKIPNLKFNNKSLQLTVDNNLFMFYLTPYYLRLRFSQLLLNEDDLPEFDLVTGKEIVKQRKIKYDIDTEHLIIDLPKKNQGEFFTDLDFVHKLMSNAIEVKLPPASTSDNANEQLKEVKTSTEDVDTQMSEQSHPESAKPQQAKLIEEIDINDPNLTTNDIKKHIESFENKTGEEFNWQFKQTFNQTKVTDENVHYGFNNLYNQVIETSVLNGSNDINELSNPGLLNEDERITERAIKENYAFNEDFYVSNYLLEKYGDQEQDYDFEMLQGSLTWKNPIKSSYLKWLKLEQEKDQSERQTYPDVKYSKELKQIMIELPKAKKEYKVPPSGASSIYYVVVSLLFAQNLNSRINCGEDNVDSAWLVGKIVPQFAYLDNKLVPAQSTDIDVSAGPIEDIKIRAEDKGESLMKEVLTTNYKQGQSSELPDISDAEKIDFSHLKDLIIILVKRSLIYPLFRNFNLISKALDDTYYTLRFGFKKVIEMLLNTRELFRKHSSYYVYNIIWLNDLASYLMLNVDSPLVNNNVLRRLAHEFHDVTRNLKKSDIVFEKLNMGDDEDTEMKNDGQTQNQEANNDQEDIELLDTTSLAQLEVIAEELYRDSKTSS